MNSRCYRLVIQHATGRLVPVPECARSHADSGGGQRPGRPAGRRGAAGLRPAALALGIALAWSSAVQANPAAPVVVNGGATFSTAGKQLTVTNTPGAIINWGSFSIGAGETTRFQQNNAASVVLNRVTGRDPSALLGSLTSNGKVFLVNPNGVIFGAGSRVDTQGFLASTLSMSDADFRAGRLAFAGDGGSIQAAGRIDGGSGDVTLVSPDIVQQGDIATRGGSVVLAAGRKVTLAQSGLDGITFEVQAAGDRAVNLGRISGGAVGLFAGSLSQQGQVEAVGVAREGGRIVLKAIADTTLTDGSTTSASGSRGGQVVIQSGATTVVRGDVEATGATGTGGAIDVLGHDIGIDGNATLSASGATGGGRLRVVGDLHGANASLPNADTTLVGAGATLNADATGRGNGGTVIVWSDRATQAFGGVSARGGAGGGDGGFAEVSGHQHLDFHARTDLSAAHGRAGTLLLDPSDVLISNAADSPADLTPFEAPGTSPGDTVVGGFTGPSQVSWTTVDTLLNNGNLVITTSGSGGSGNISLADSHTLASPNSLSLLAHNDITQQIGSTLVNSVGHGGLTMVAGWDESSGVETPTALAGIGHINAGGLEFNDTIALTAGSDISLWGTATSRQGDIAITSGTGKLALHNAGGSTTSLVAAGMVTLAVPAGIESEAGSVGQVPDVIADKLTVTTGGPVAWNTTLADTVPLYVQVNKLDVTLNDPGNTTYPEGRFATLPGAGPLELTHALLGRSKLLTLQSWGDVVVSGTVDLVDPSYGATMEIDSLAPDVGVTFTASSSLGPIGYLRMTTDNLQIDGPFAPSGLLVLQPFTATRGIDLGSEDPTRLSITSDEFSRITVGEFQLFGTDVHVSAPISSATVGVLQTGTHVRVDAPLTLSAPTSLIDFNADTVDINAQVSAGTEGIMLGRNTGTRAGDPNWPTYLVGLPDGVAKPGNGGIELTQHEISLLHTTGAVYIGDAFNSGSVITNPLHVVGPVDMTGVAHQLYLTGTTVLEDAGASITADELAVVGHSQVSFGGINHVGVFTAATKDTADLSSIYFRGDTRGYQVGATTGVWFNQSGVDSLGQVTLVSEGGSITQSANAPIQARQLVIGAHNVALNAPDNVVGMLSLAIDTDPAASSLGAMTVDYTQNSVLAGNTALLVDNNAGVRTGALTLRGDIPVVLSANPYVFQGATADTPMITKVQGSLSVSAGTSLSGIGTVDVSAADGTLSVSGTLQPGVHYPNADALGTLKVNGNLVLGPTASVETRLQGSTAGQFDQLAVTGAATLDGALTVSSSLATPTLAADVPMVTFGSRSGAFATLTLPTGIDHVYNANDLTLYQGAGGGASIFWDNDSGDGQWTTAINWSGNALPAAADAVTINAGPGSGVTLASGDQGMTSLLVAHKNLSVTGGSLSVSGAFTMTDGSLTIAPGGRVNANGTTALDALIVSGGTLAGHGAITANTLDWSRGVISGNADPMIEIGGNATIHNTLGGSLQLDGRTMSVGGTFTVAGSGWLDMLDGAHLFALGPTVLDTSGAQGTFFGINSMAGAPSSVSFAGGITKTGSEVFDIAVAADTTGTVHDTQGGLVFDAGFVAASSGGTHNGTSFVADAGASIEFARGTHYANGNVTFGGAGQVVFRGSAELTAVQANTATNTGAMLVEQGAIISAPLTNQGTLTLVDNVVASGGLTNAAGATLALGSADITGGLSNAGTVNVGPGNSSVSLLGGPSGGNSGALHIGNGATLTVNSAVTNAATGLIDGTGTLALGNATLTNHGTVAPGGDGAAGTLSVTGNYLQASDGRLSIDLGGTGAGQADLLAVSGTAVLGGRLAATLLPGYTPGEDIVPVLSFGSRSGNFDTFALPTAFGHSYGPNQLSLTHSSFTGVSWDNDSGDGLWTTAANWNTNTLPTAADPVLIHAGAGAQVDLVSGDQSVASLSVVGKVLRIDGGSLSVAGELTSDSNLIIDGGTLNMNGGALLHDVSLRNGTLAGSGFIGIDHGLTWSGGHIAGSGTVTLGYASSNLVGGPVTLDGALLNQGQLHIAADSVVNGGQTLTNVGTLNIDSAAIGARIDNQSGGLVDVTGYTTTLSGVASQLGATTIEPGATLVIHSTGAPGYDGTNAAAFDIAGTLQALTPLSVNHLTLESTGIVGASNGQAQAWAMVSAADATFNGGLVNAGARLHSYDAVINGVRIDHASVGIDSTIDEYGDATLSAATLSTYAAWNLHGGHITLDAASTMGTGTLNVMGAGTLTGSASLPYASIFGGATLTLQPTAAGQTLGGAISNAGTLRVAASSGLTTLAGTVTGGTLEVDAGGNLQVNSGNNQFSATNLAGSLGFGPASSGNDLGALTWTSNGTSLALDNAGLVASAQSLDWRGDTLLTGTLHVAHAAHVDTIGLLQGDLVVGGATTLGNLDVQGRLIATDILQTGTVTVSGTVNASGTYTLAGGSALDAGALGPGNVHAASLVKTGSDPASLNGFNAAPVTADHLEVAGGTLTLNNTTLIASGQVDAGASVTLAQATLGGTIASAGALQVASSGTASTLSGTVTGGTLDIASGAALNITGANSAFDATRMAGTALNVGYGADANSLGALNWVGGNIAAYGGVAASSLSWSDIGRQLGGSLTGHMTVSGDARIAGGTIAGSLAVGGAVTMGSPTFNRGQLTARDITQTGLATVGTGSTITATGTYTLDDRAEIDTLDRGVQVRAGTLVIPGTARALLDGNTGQNAFAVDDLVVDGQLAMFNVGITATSAQLHGGSRLALERSSLAGTVTSAGTLAIDADAVASALAGTVTGGIIDIAPSATLAVADGFVNTPSTRLQGSGTLQVGNGTGTLVNQGTLAPGSAGAPGTLAIKGNLVEEATGTIVIGENGGGSNSLLAVSGTATLAGALLVTASAPSLAPLPGNGFSAITYASEMGTFGSIALPSGQRSFTSPSSVVVVPMAGITQIGLAAFSFGQFQLLMNPPTPTFARKPLFLTHRPTPISGALHGVPVATP